MTIKAYLAGPDVFLPNALAHAQRKVEICARYGIAGLPPLNEDISNLMQQDSTIASQMIYEKDVAMMDEADIIIANLTPFGGVSADSGTLIEVGYYLGQGKPIFGYTNSAQLFDQRMHAFIKLVPPPVTGMAVEGFGLHDNLMVPGAVLQGGGLPVFMPDDGRDRAFDDLAIFEQCVAATARHLDLFHQPNALTA